MNAKKKCRQYMETPPYLKYLKFGFIASPHNVQLPFCLICEKTFSNEAMQPSQLKEHLLKIHFDKLEKPLSFFQDLKIKKSVPLSNDTVSKRIDKMADDVEKKLVNSLRKSDFTLQIDESTVTDNKAILLAYVRFINNNKEFVEELLFAKSLITDTKGSSIFQMVNEYFTQKNIPLTNIIACATDGTPSTTGRHVEFIANLKKPFQVSLLFIVLFLLLFKKKLSGILHETLQYVIKSVNKIKASSLNDRLFRELCFDNDEEFERLLRHTAVRWLSKGKCLCRFFELFDSVIEFFDKIDPVLKDNLKQRKIEIGYLTDIFQKMNEVNLKLQGNNIIFIKAKWVVSPLIAKFDLYKMDINRQELSQFPNLRACSDANGEIPVDKIKIFSDHILQLKNDMKSRFKDLLELQIPNWILDAIILQSVEDLEPDLQMEFIDLKHDCVTQIVFKQVGFELAWVKLKDKYPQLWRKLSCYFFPSRQRI